MNVCNLENMRNVIIMEPDTRHYFAFLVAMVCLFQGVLSQNGCDSHWHIYYGNCYLFSENLPGGIDMTWDKARADCANRSAHLATIQDVNTWNWIVWQMTSLELSDELWIGLYKASNIYTWDDGTKTDSLNFFWRKPTGDGSLGPNTCVYATRAGWVESLCSETYHYICYKPVPRLAAARDSLVITFSIIGSFLGVLILVWLAYYFIPDETIHHEELDKNVEKSDKQREKQKRAEKSTGDARIREEEKAREVYENKAFDKDSSASSSARS